MVRLSGGVSGLRDNAAAAVQTHPSRFPLNGGALEGLPSFAHVDGTFAGPRPALRVHPPSAQLAALSKRGTVLR